MGNNIDVFRPGFSITADVLSAVTAISFAKDSPSLRGSARGLGGGKTLCSVSIPKIGLQKTDINCNPNLVQNDNKT